MFSERDVMVMQEQMKDRTRRREKERLLAPVRGAQRDVPAPSPWQSAVMTVQVLAQRVRTV